MTIAFDNSYARLPGTMHTSVQPTRVDAPRIIRINQALAADLGIDPASLTADVAVGNRVPDGAMPIAQAYAGHQFGHFSPQLGDGRAILLGEVVDTEGRRRDIQLKGAGQTPFSRRGDGRAALGPVLREYLVSEAMHALGIPTTRALMAATTGEQVYRQGALPGAVLTRVAASHIRVGTFQFFAARRDGQSVKQLADHVIDRHYPAARNAEHPYLALLDQVMEAQARLIARWMGVGFIHGVMNTDNMAVSGETIDYGPCAFLDVYDPATVFSSIDEGGRYAFGNQAPIAQWNLARLAETLLGLIDEDSARAVEIATAKIEGFPELFAKAWLGVMRAKIGLASEEDDDAALIQDLLGIMEREQADFTVTFRRLAENEDMAMLGTWMPLWRQRLTRDPQSTGERKSLMRQSNPAFIPRNHLVEEMIAAAVAHGDYQPFEKMLAVLSRPFDDQPGAARYGQAPGVRDTAYRTFCGT